MKRPPGAFSALQTPITAVRISVSGVNKKNLNHANFTVNTGTGFTFHGTFYTSGVLRIRLTDDTATTIPGLALQNGTTSIPEPPTGLLLASVAIVLRRRRRCLWG